MIARCVVWLKGQLQDVNLRSKDLCARTRRRQCSASDSFGGRESTKHQWWKGGKRDKHWTAGGCVEITGKSKLGPIEEGSSGQKSAL